jgi:hypothetical protein
MKILLALCLGVPAAHAAGTAVWEMTTYKDFIGGVFRNVSLSREGRLTVGPELTTLLASEQPLVWSLARAADGTLYLGTGHRGRVYRVDPKGATGLFWTASEPEVFALELGPDGALYAGTSPDGKVYRITSDGKAVEFFLPQSKYIWALVFGSDGVLYVGTGDRGRIHRVDRSGKGELWFDTRQTHVTSLAVDPKGALLAGTDPNGILYRITAKDKAFVLYDSNLAEIRSIQVGSDGYIYAAAMGGSTAKAQQAGATPAGGEVVISPVVQSITVTASEAQAPPRPPEAPKPGSPGAPAAAPAAPAPAPVVAPSYPGAQKSALLRIAADNTVEMLWTSTEENVYAVLPQPQGLLFSTDDRGRIYRLEPGRQATLLAQTGEEETTRLALAGDTVVAATSNLGKLYRLEQKTAPVGTYEAPVRDAGSVARWGKLSWKAQTPSGTSIAFSTRSGNSARPDHTWSEWSAPVRDPEGSPVTSPNARFIQWRAELRGAGGRGPVLESVSFPYLPQNAPPVIKSILVTPTQMSVSKAPTPSTPATTPSAAGAADFTITVTDTGAVSTATNPGTPTAALSRSSGQAQVTSISWQAEDPDGDRLTARVSFRGEGETEWKLIKENLAESYLTLDPDVLADGVYQVQVLVSDAQSNPASAARDAEMISAPFLIDNTPPAVRLRRAERRPGRAEVWFEAQDTTSILRRAEYSLDAGPWSPVFPEDGILDSKSENFQVVLENLKAGEHLVTLRVSDSAGNSGLAKAVLR